MAQPLFLLTFSAMILIMTAKGEVIKNMVPPRFPIEEPQPGFNNTTVITVITETSDKINPVLPIQVYCLFIIFFSIILLLKSMLCP